MNKERSEQRREKRSERPLTAEELRVRNLAKAELNNLREQLIKIANECKELKQTYQDQYGNEYKRTSVFERFEPEKYGGYYKRMCEWNIYRKELEYDNYLRIYCSVELKGDLIRLEKLRQRHGIFKDVDTLEEFHESNLESIKQYAELRYQYQTYYSAISFLHNYTKRTDFSTLNKAVDDLMVQLKIATEAREVAKYCFDNRDNCSSKVLPFAACYAIGGDEESPTIYQIKPSFFAMFDPKDWKEVKQIMCTLTSQTEVLVFKTLTELEMLKVYHEMNQLDKEQMKAEIDRTVGFYEEWFSDAIRHPAPMDAFGSDNVMWLNDVEDPFEEAY
jgi:hypothetical protein